MDEFKTLYNYDFPDNRLKQVRDSFFFGCLTGMAFIDIDTLNPEHINNGIETPPSYKDFSKGETSILIVPKYKLVGSHTARKTFISLFYNQTKDMNLTKKFSGIEQEKTLRRYMGSDREMERQAMKKAFSSLTRKCKRV